MYNCCVLLPAPEIDERYQNKNRTLDINFIYHAILCQDLGFSGTYRQDTPVINRCISYFYGPGVAPAILTLCYNHARKTYSGGIDKTKLIQLVVSTDRAGN